MQFRSQNVQMCFFHSKNWETLVYYGGNINHLLIRNCPPFSNQDPHNVNAPELIDRFIHESCFFPFHPSVPLPLPEPSLLNSTAYLLHLLMLCTYPWVSHTPGPPGSSYSILKILQPQDAFGVSLLCFHNTPHILLLKHQSLCTVIVGLQICLQF